MSTAVRAATEAGLWLYLRGLGRLLALPADVVEHALLVDEAGAPQWPPALGPAVAPVGCVGRLAVRGATYGAWDLGLLLGYEAAQRSWILLRLPFGGGTLPVALRTDECLHVGALSRLRQLELPAGARGERALFRAAFPAANVGGAKSGGALVGLEMDPMRLLTDYELEFTGELLRQDA